MKILWLICILLGLSACRQNEVPPPISQPIATSSMEAERSSAPSSSTEEEKPNEIRFYTLDIIQNSQQIFVAQEDAQSGEIVQVLYDIDTQESVPVPLPICALKSIFDTGEQILFATEIGIYGYTPQDGLKNFTTPENILFDYDFDANASAVAYADAQTSDFRYQTDTQVKMFFPVNKNENGDILSRGAFPDFSPDGKQLIFFESSAGYMVRSMLYNVSSDTTTTHTETLVVPGMICGWAGDCYYIARYLKNDEMDRPSFRSYLVWDGHAFIEYETEYDYTDAVFKGSNALFVDVDGNVHIRSSEGQMDEIVFAAGKEYRILDAVVTEEQIVIIDENTTIQVVDNPFA